VKARLAFLAASKDPHPGLERRALDSGRLASRSSSFLVVSRLGVTTSAYRISTGEEAGTFRTTVALVHAVVRKDSLSQRTYHGPTRQHGSRARIALKACRCGLHCVQVPFPWHDPVTGQEKVPELLQVSSLLFPKFLRPSPPVPGTLSAPGPAP
jgi:hypothetical protein